MTCRGWCLVAVAMALVASPVRAADSLTAVLDPYFRIQAQLAEDSHATTKADAEAVATAAAALGPAGGSIVTAANDLAATTTLEAAREAFGKLLTLPPADAAAAIIRGIEARAPRIVIGKDAQNAALIQRLMPVGYWNTIVRLSGGKL